MLKLGTPVETGTLVEIWEYLLGLEHLLDLGTPVESGYIFDMEL